MYRAFGSDVFLPAERIQALTPKFFHDPLADSNPLITMSSTSPSKEPEVDPEVQSGEEQDMDKDQLDPSQGQGEFEVKEQDRWLPIANG